jgi:hypothetical protein
MSDILDFSSPRNKSVDDMVTIYWDAIQIEKAYNGYILYISTNQGEHRLLFNNKDGLIKHLTKLL